MEKLLLVGTKSESSGVRRLHLLPGCLALHIQEGSSHITDILNTTHNPILTYLPYKVEISRSLPKLQVRAC